MKDYNSMDIESLKRIASQVNEELAKRKVSQPSEIYLSLKKYHKKTVEYFIVITLDGANHQIKIHEVTKGLLNRTVVHPREVFQEAIKDGANAIVVAHNHPSGKLEFSSEDRAITKRLRDAGEILGITVLDHMIIASTGYSSALEEGIL